jgi:hypothetical protein
VDQVQVEVVEAEPLQRLLEGSPGAVLAAVLDPQLGGDEQLVPRDAAVAMARPKASSFRYASAVSRWR